MNHYEVVPLSHDSHAGGLTAGFAGFVLRGDGIRVARQCDIHEVEVAEDADGHFGWSFFGAGGTSDAGNIPESSG